MRTMTVVEWNSFRESRVARVEVVAVSCLTRLEARLEFDEAMTLTYLYASSSELELELLDCKP